MICRCEYYANLLVISMRDIAVILGVDWLSNHGAQINCEEKTISIRSPGGRRVLFQGDRYTRLDAELQLHALQ